MGGKITVFERAARVYFFDSLRARRAGNIHGSGSRETRIISQKSHSASTLGRGGSWDGRECFLAWVL